MTARAEFRPHSGPADRPNARATEDAPAQLPTVLTVQDAANMLGVNAKTVYEAIHRHSLPARRIGSRRIVILRDALITWLSQGRISPSEESR